jgi:hypothetical protein
VPLQLYQHQAASLLSPSQERVQVRRIHLCSSGNVAQAGKLTESSYFVEYASRLFDFLPVAQVLLQNRRLRISATLPESRTLVEELLSYRLKQNIATGHVAFEPWRGGQHDDLVLALCLALWAAGKPSASVDESLATTTGDAISEEDLYTWDDRSRWKRR